MFFKSFFFCFGLVVKIRFRVHDIDSLNAFICIYFHLILYALYPVIYCQILIIDKVIGILIKIQKQ